MAAPPLDEGDRTARVRDWWTADGLAGLRVDPIGNVWARLRDGDAGGDGPAVVVAAHLDTVFARSVAHGATRDGDRLLGPSVGDDSVALAALSALDALLPVDGRRTRVDPGDRGGGGPREPGRHHRGPGRPARPDRRAGGPGGQLARPGVPRGRGLDPLAGHRRRVPAGTPGSGPTRRRPSTRRPGRWRTRSPSAAPAARRRRSTWAGSAAASRSTPGPSTPGSRSTSAPTRRPPSTTSTGPSAGPWRSSVAGEERAGVAVAFEEIGRRPAGALPPDAPARRGGGRRPACRRAGGHLHRGQHRRQRRPPRAACRPWPSA